MELVYKGQSRCFVFKEEDIKTVYSTIKEIDEFEYDYTPTDWVTTWDDGKYEHKWVYNGKFDINVPELIKRCGEKGVGIIVRSTHFQDDCP